MVGETDMTVTLDNCESEPIHVPGAVQPHGVLLAARGGVVVQVSANVEALLGLSPAAVIDQPLASLFEETPLLVELEKRAQLRDANPFRLTARSGAAFDAVAHRSGDAFVLEIEPASARSGTIGGFDPRLRASVLRLQGVKDVRSLLNVVAEEVRRLTGFDRVMVYRFDAAWNGEVVAESKREDLGSFLGQCYPASDIPAQARRLYTINWLRFIADVDYEPSPLVPDRELDLSGSTLRSVSPIHLQYLRNMGVRASMSISLVIDGVLSGLIACHHYAGPRLLPLTVRDTAEYLGYTLSWQLQVLESADRAAKARETQRHEAEVVRSVAIAGELLDGLDTPALMALAEAEGAAVVLEEGIRRIGHTPPAAGIARIVDFLRAKAPDVYATDHLAADLPEATAWEECAAGLVAVAIARELGEYVLWFRPAVTRVVNWAGDPSSKPDRLTPRGSFELWQQTIKGYSLPWDPSHVEAASSLRRVLLTGVRTRAVQLRNINQRLLDTDRAKDDFIATVSHELRTPLNAISGWASMLRSHRLEPDRARHAIEVIERNVQTQLRLVEDLLDVSRMTSGKLVLEVEHLDLAALVTNVLDASSLAIQAKGIELVRDLQFASRVRGDTVRLRQVVANLVTNAVKFTPKGGRITVRLLQSGSDVELVVEDTGKGIEPTLLPHVFEAFRQGDSSMSRRSHGLGLGLAIVKKLVELHGGRISVESEGAGTGSIFRVHLPITALLAPSRDRLSPSEPLSPVRAPAVLVGVSALVVEDDPDSRELISHLLATEDANVTAVGDAPAALAVLSTQRFDVIVSDVGLPEIDGLELMRRFRAQPEEQAQRTPAVALTAYTRASDRTAALLAGFQAHVPKPVDHDELVATLLSVLGRPARR